MQGKLLPARVKEESCSSVAAMRDKDKGSREVMLYGLIQVSPQRNYYFNLNLGGTSTRHAKRRCIRRRRGGQEI